MVFSAFRSPGSCKTVDLQADLEMLLNDESVSIRQRSSEFRGKLFSGPTVRGETEH
jgi:hypothetical protein